MASNESPAIKIRGLTTAFGSNVIHDDLDLDVMPGEILGVVGASGEGKSVLLRSIIGLHKPRSGEVEVLGHNIAELSTRDMRGLQKRWGVLFQDGALFSSLTVAQNVEVPMLEHFDLPPTLMHELCAMKISMGGLPCEASILYPSQLSGGMRKRAGIARALALDPEILFLDEPTSGLDPIGAAAFDQLIKQLKDTLNLTVFLVTHDLDTLASVCDRIAVLAEKRVIAVGTMQEMLQHRHPWIQEYFHGPRARAVVGR